MLNIEVTLIQTMKGQSVQNVIHFINPDGALSLQTIADFMTTDWIPALKPIQNTAVVYRQIQVRDLDNPATATFLLNTAIPGTAVGFDARLPPLCIVIQKKTNRAGRKGRGRLYISGFDEGSLDTTGTWSAGHLTGVMATAVNNLRERFFLGGAQQTGLALAIMGRGPDNGIELTPVTNLIVRPVPGLQRRRSIGVGI